MQSVIDGMPVPRKQNSRSQQLRRRRNERALQAVLDIIAISLVLLIFSLIYLLVPPYNQGFYCDDRTILKPYRNDTIPMWSVAIYAGLVPVFIIVVIELWRYMPLCPYGVQKQDRFDICRNVFHTVCLFGLGIGATFLLTEVGKRSYGRLRPHFIDVCKPDWSHINCFEEFKSSKGKSIVFPRYITEYACLGKDVAKIKEARISFPSGHSSITCFAFCFLLVYFESRLFCTRIRFLKPVLQCACICVMFFTCLSRITDHKHHYSDVLGGALIGALTAFFITLRVANVFGSGGLQHRERIFMGSQRIAVQDSFPVCESKYTQYELDNNIYVSSGQLEDHSSVSLLKENKHLAKERMQFTTEDNYDNLAYYQNPNEIDQQ